MERNGIGWREKWPEKVGRGQKSGRKSREGGKNKKLEIKREISMRR